MGPMQETVRPYWAPRVRPQRIRRLYENDARGILDEELIDEVGYALYMRCRSILQVTTAYRGRVQCPRCEGEVERKSRDRKEPLHCAGCGWGMTWGAYLDTVKGKNLYGGGAVDAFAEYAKKFERARGPREKLLLIDRLIHTFHWREYIKQYTRPAGVNLIEGTWEEVLEFLDRLTHGDSATPEMRENRRSWYEAWNRSPISLAQKGRGGD